jgi:two-component system chemotaxis sensor kinase CheA
VSELLDQFLVEGRELIEQATDDLLALERDPADTARLDGAFRAVHTLKGSVALFDFAPMERALHAAEDLLDAVRGGHVAAERGVLDPLLKLIGASEGWIEAIARTGGLPEDASARGRGLEEALRAALGGSPLPGTTPAVRNGTEWLPDLVAAEARAVAAAQAEGKRLTAVRYVPSPDCFFLGDDPMALVRAVPDLVAVRLSPREPWPEGGPEPFACNLVIELLTTAGEPEVRQTFRFVADQVDSGTVPPPGRAPEAPPADARAANGFARSLRVDAGRVDALVDLAGELIVAKNGLAHLVARAGEADPRLARALAESQAGIERLAEGLHRAAMGLRMTPLSRAFRRLPRLVREAAAALGKEVALEIRGEAVEADRAVVDGLFDPLLHLLRNAVDHGIEDLAARVAAGKPATGRITIEASREADGFAVTVTDDGRGLDPGQIRRVARERRVLPDAAIDAMDDDAAAQLVFQPGFSTAASVTALSGRGVGMDAVRAGVERLGGRIAMTNRPGAGLVVRLMLPQGATVTTVLMVRLGAETFGVQVEAIRETVRVPSDRILPLRDAEAFVLRDRTVPLLRLAGLLGLPTTARGAAVRVIVLGSRSGTVGVEVDGFAGQSDVLLRPLSGLLSGMPGMLGTALLGDGRVLMVLDLPELIG